MERLDVAIAAVILSVRAISDTFLDVAREMTAETKCRHRTPRSAKRSRRIRHLGSARLVYCLLLALLAGCGPNAANSAREAEPRAAAKPLEERFRVELAGESPFQPPSRDLDRYFMPDIMGNGVCLADWDGDDDLDMFLAGADGNRLLFNDAGRFVDRTAGSGIEACGYATGAVASDFDNDGDLDLYVTCYEGDCIFANRGEGRFEDISETAGVRNPQWATAAAARDIDQDGRVDLIVVNYLDYQISNRCDDGSGRPDFCGPTTLPGLVDRVYLNRSVDGDIRFIDATVNAGLASAPGRGLGLLCGDFDLDGRVDFFVANDMEPNRLWLQTEPGRFRDAAVTWGVAVNGIGRDEASMGVASGDWNRDGRSDIFLTHLRGESNTAYVRDEASFLDHSGRLGLAAPSVPFTGFGVVAADLNHDGLEDLAIANGRVKRASSGGKSSSFWSDYAETNQIYLAGDTGFHDASHLGGEFSGLAATSRALAWGDLDGDGDVDLVVSHEDAPVQICWNEFEKVGEWLMVAPASSTQKHVLGCRVEIISGGRILGRETRAVSSYLSQSDPRAHFGVPPSETAPWLRVRWPNGDWEDFQLAGLARVVTVRQGEGEPHDADRWRSLVKSTRPSEVVE